MLEERSTKTQFVIATTHAYWDPKLSDLKVLQASQLLVQVEVHTTFLFVHLILPRNSSLK